MVFGAGILVVVARLVVWFVGCGRLLVLIVDTFRVAVNSVGIVFVLPLEVGIWRCYVPTWFLVVLNCFVVV